MDRRSELEKKKKALRQLCRAVGRSVRHLRLRRGFPEQVMAWVTRFEMSLVLVSEASPSPTQLSWHLRKNPSLSISKLSLNLC